MFNFIGLGRQKIHENQWSNFPSTGLEGVSTLPLAERRKILAKTLKPDDHISTYPAEVGSSTKILTFVKEHGLEGVVAKRLDGLYEPGKRSGSWCKYRINLGQEFVVGGYTPGGNGFDALIIGFYRGKDLFFFRTRSRGIRASHASTGFCHDQGSQERQLPVCESAGKIRRPMGPGPDGGENEILYIDQAQSRGASRFRGMDRRREVAAHEIHRPAGGQRSALDKSARWTLMF